MFGVWGLLRQLARLTARGVTQRRALRVPRAPWLRYPCPLSLCSRCSLRLVVIWIQVPQQSPITATAAADCTVILFYNDCIEYLV
eukprot:SAG31_NODE_6924_length_1848_cov_17.412236_2_plen_85_part_00